MYLLFRSQISVKFLVDNFINKFIRTKTFVLCQSMSSYNMARVIFAHTKSLLPNGKSWVGSFFQIRFIQWKIWFSYC